MKAPRPWAWGGWIFRRRAAWESAAAEISSAVESAGVESMASQLPARQAAPLPLPELLPEHCPSCCPSAVRTLGAESLLCAAPLCEPSALLADYPLLAPGSCRLHLPRADRLLTALPFGEARA